MIMDKIITKNKVMELISNMVKNDITYMTPESRKEVSNGYYRRFVINGKIKKSTIEYLQSK